MWAYRCRRRCWNYCRSILSCVQKIEGRWRHYFQRGERRWRKGWGLRRGRGRCFTFLAIFGMYMKPRDYEKWIPFIVKIICIQVFLKLVIFLILVSKHGLEASLMPLEASLMVPDWSLIDKKLWFFSQALFRLPGGSAPRTPRPNFR